MAKSTKIIAALGVAGALGVAAMPLSSYAADPEPRVTITDTISLNVASTCAFEKEDGNADALVATEKSNAVVGQEVTWDNGGSHVFRIHCTDNTYEVKAKATDLVFDTSTGATTPTAHGTIEYIASDSYGETPTIGDDGKWTAKVEGASAISKTESSIKTGNATSTDTFTVTYRAYVGKAQTAGTYNGSVTYKLIAPVSA